MGRVCGGLATVVVHGAAVVLGAGELVVGIGARKVGFSFGVMRR